MARELAPSSGFVIIVESATHQTLLPEFQSFLYSPGEGRFTVTEDSHKVASIVVQLIWNKLLLCLREGDLHNYRFILNQQATRLRNLNIDPVDLAIPGFNPSQDPFVNPEAFALARFMHQNGFEAVTQIDEAGWSPLCYAAMNGSSAVVSELLRRRADANECTQKGTKEAQFPKKMTALSLSACFRSNEVMQVLLSARAAVNVRDGRRQTALHWACISNNAEGVRILVKAGANAEMLAITGQSAFQLACSAGALEAISEILLQFPKQDLQYSLHFAFLLGGGSGHLVRTLFEAKADVNERLELLQTKYLLLWTLCKAASFSHRVGASTRLRELAFHHRRATPLMPLVGFETHTHTPAQKVFQFFGHHASLQVQCNLRCLRSYLCTTRRWGSPRPAELSREATWKQEREWYVPVLWPHVSDFAADAPAQDCRGSRRRNLRTSSTGCQTRSCTGPPRAQCGRGFQKFSMVIGHWSRFLSSCVKVQKASANLKLALCSSRQICRTLQTRASNAAALYHSRGRMVLHSSRIMQSW